jgi:biotin operon repressor
MTGRPIPRQPIKTSPLTQSAVLPRKGYLNFSSLVTEGQLTDKYADTNARLADLKQMYSLSSRKMATMCGSDERSIRRYLKGSRTCPAEVISALENNLRPSAIKASPDSELKQKVMSLAQVGAVSVGEISRQLDRSKETVVRLIDELHQEGYEIEIDEGTRQVELRRETKRDFSWINVSDLFKNQLKFLMVSDSHFGSKYQQPTLLHTAYHIAAEEGCAFGMHGGDLSDGHPSMHKGMIYEQWYNANTDDLVDYITDVYPQAPFKTYILDAGTHDTIFVKMFGYNLVRNVCQRRHDLVQRKGDEAVFGHDGQIHCRLRHPTGGVAYARSYHIQKYNTALMEHAMHLIDAGGAGEEYNPRAVYPHVVAVGHYHLSMYMPMAGSHVFGLPCFQSQTPYLRDKGLFPQVGFWIVTLHFDCDGRVSKVEPQAYQWTHLVRENDY